MISSKDVTINLDSEILNGDKIPHQTSLPVLRKENGKIYIAVFVSFYDADDVREKKLPRPSLWALGDIETGEIVNRYDCRENDFSDSELDQVIDVAVPTRAKITAEYMDNLYEMFDNIRDHIIETGNVDYHDYEKYLMKVIDIIPFTYQKFFFEMSDLDETEESKADETAENEEADTTVADTGETADGGETSDNCGEVVKILGRLENEIKNLQTSFDESIKFDEYKNKLFDNMHNELTEYKNGFAEKLVDTMAMDVIRVIDDITKLEANYGSREPSEDNYKRLLRQVGGVAQDLQDVLYRQNIEVYEVQEDEVDIKRQKIAKVIETEDETLDKKVAEILAVGYEKEGKILRPERVNVYKFNKKEN